MSTEFSGIDSPNIIDICISKLSNPIGLQGFSDAYIPRGCLIPHPVIRLREAAGDSFRNHCNLLPSSGGEGNCSHCSKAGHRDQLAWRKRQQERADFVPPVSLPPRLKLQMAQNTNPQSPRNFPSQVGNPVPPTISAPHAKIIAEEHVGPSSFSLHLPIFKNVNLLRRQ